MPTWEKTQPSTKGANSAPLSRVKQLLNSTEMSTVVSIKVNAYRTLFVIVMLICFLFAGLLFVIRDACRISKWYGHSRRTRRQIYRAELKRHLQELVYDKCSRSQKFATFRKIQKQTEAALIWEAWLYFYHWSMFVCRNDCQKTHRTVRSNW